MKRKVLYYFCGVTLIIILIVGGSVDRNIFSGSRFPNYACGRSCVHGEVSNTSLLCSCVGTRVSSLCC